MSDEAFEISHEPHYPEEITGRPVSVNSYDTTPDHVGEELNRLGISSEGIPFDAPDEPE